MKKNLKIISLGLLLVPFVGYSQLRLSPNAELNARITATALCKKYGGNIEMQKGLQLIFINSALETEMAFSVSKGIELEQMLTRIALKTDSLKELYLAAKTEKKMPVSAFSGVLNYKKSLQLSQGQIDSLAKKAIVLEQMKRDFKAKNPGKNFDAKPLEKDLEVILTEKQLTGYFNAKNMAQATKWAKNDWEEMKVLGMTGGLDSATVVKSIMVYDMRRLSAKDRYATDPVKLSVAISDIDQALPESLQQLRSARSHRNPTGDKAMKSSFTW